MASKLKMTGELTQLKTQNAYLLAQANDLKSALAKERKAKEVEQAAKNVLRIELATVRTGLAWAKRPLWRKCWDYLRGEKR